VVFVLVERRIAEPMLDLTLFRKPAFAGASVAAFVLSASMFSMFLYLTLYIQNVLGYSPLQAGLRFLPVSVLSFVAAPLAGRLMSSVPIRLLLFGGLSGVGSGLMLMRGISPSSGWTTLLAGFCAAGIGVGFVNPPLSFTAVGVVEQRLSGTASGINNTFRQVGVATGVAGLGAFLQSRVTDKLDSLLAGTHLPPSATHRLGEAVASGGGDQAVRGVPAQARAAVAEAADRAFIYGLNEILLIAAIVAFTGAILALLLVRRGDFVIPAEGAEAPREEDRVPARA
jgi:hypothetical protein